MSSASTADPGPKVWLFSLSHILGFGIWAVASILLWTRAEWIAQLIARPDRSHVTGPVSRDDIQQVLFTAVGLFILVSAAGDLAEALYVLYTLKGQGLGPPQVSAYTSRTLVDAAKSLIGLLLVLGSSGLVGLIKRFRETG